MRVAFLFFLGLFLYIAAAEGNMGSLLACFIDPSALQEGITASGNTTGTVNGVTSTTPKGVPGGPFTPPVPPGPDVMQPDPAIKTNNGCKQGYVFVQGVGCYKVIPQAN
jgi:hypothetical protein